MILAVVLAYLCLVMLVGVMAHRLFRGTGDDFFVASRSIGPFVLLMTLVGTNMTAFTMLGSSGEAYRRGILVFALMGSSSAIVIPFVFYYMGLRAWWTGKQRGYVTQVQLIRDRYGSKLLGTLLFGVLVLLMLPYLLIGVKGGGAALAAVTAGSDTPVPSWAGSLLVCSVVFFYVTYGGMRSTAWVNTFQTAVFMLVGVVAYFTVLSGLGGLEAAMARLAAARPSHVTVPDDSVTRWQMLSYVLMPLCLGGFPHIYSHWLSARSAASFRAAIVFYPLCFAIVWFPSVVLGAVGALAFEAPLDGPILVKSILAHSDGIVAGCLAAGVFAAIMSSLDSQILALGAMFTEDIVGSGAGAGEAVERRRVLLGRSFVSAFLALAFVCSLFTSRSIFELGTWSLTGFAGLCPVFAAALFWPRSSAFGATLAVSIVALLWLGFFVDSAGIQGPYSVAGTGLLPVAVIVPASAACVALGSLVRPDRRLPAALE